MKTRFSDLVRLPTIALLLSGTVVAEVHASLAPAVSNLPPLSATLRDPTRIARDANGNIFVVESAGGRVVVYDAFNRLTAEMTGFRTPLGIAVDAAGNIYLGEAAVGSVSVFGPQWNLIRQLGQGANEFLMPGHIAVDSSGGSATVYVADSKAHEIKAYQDGSLVRRIGRYGSGTGEFKFPAGLWTSPGGELFAVDQSNDRVQVFNREGVFQRVFTLAPPEFGGRRSGRTQGLVGDARGRLYAADTFQGIVKVFDHQGVFLSSFSNYGVEPGALRSPGGLALDAAGRLFVASPNNGRVEVFGLDCFTQLTVTPADRVASIGAAVTFSAQTSCQGPFTFQWLRGTNELADGGIISGATNATLTLAGVTAEDAGGYSVVITGPQGKFVSPQAQLLLTAAPVIVSSPTSRTVSQGSTVSVGVGATGNDLTYRWFFNGIELLVPSTNTLVLPNIQPSDAGKYWAVVENAAGSATSAQATLTVLMLPIIVVAPTNQSAVERGSASFSVVGFGSAPLRYQWFRGQAVLANQTNSTLVLTNVTPAWNGTYYARVFNTAGATNSPAAMLTVSPDTLAPTALFAAGGAPTNRAILVSFSEPVNVASAQQPARYELVGPGGLTVVNAVVTNNSRVRLTLSGNRIAGGDYFLRVGDVVDTAFSPNVMSPNPAMLSVIAADSVGTIAWWPLNEASGTVARDNTGNGFDGTLENSTWTPGRSGWAVNMDGTAGDVLLPALNLYTNTVTITAWIRRSGSQPGSAGIVFCRAGNTVAGLSFGTANELRYNWNNASAAYNFNSGLVVPDSQWAFVALVVEPARAKCYLNTGTGLRSATNTATHAIEEFNGAAYLGWDTSNTSRRFRGALDDVRVCNRALTAAELQALYNAVASPATCYVTSPVFGEVLGAGDVVLNAFVSANGNLVNKVEYFSGATMIGAARTAPFTCLWTNLPSGNYSVQARAYYSPANYTVNSSLVNFTVAIPLAASMTLLGGQTVLQWSGGSPPYQVQISTNLATPNWANVGGSTTNMSLLLTPDKAAAFYRIVGQ